MRSAGKLPTEDQARRFADYLLTKKLPARVEADSGEFAIWIHEEDQLEEARRELDAFRSEPNHERYVKVSREAQTIRREQEKKAEETRKQMQQMRQKWNRPATQSKPLTIVLIVICVVIGIFTGFGDIENPVSRTLLFVEPVAYVRAGGPTLSSEAPLSSETLNTKLLSIKRGEIWRLVTPAFLHFGGMHLAFNMIMLFQLGGLIEQRIGSVRFGLLVLTLSILSMVPTELMPYRLVFPFYQPSSPFGAGMSGVVYGLAGYLWAKTMVDPMAGYAMRPTFLFILLAWLVVGIVGILDQLLGANVSNWAHLLGLVVGFAIPFIGAAISGKRS